MLPFYGRLRSCREWQAQRIVGKPVGIGYEGWVLAQSNGCFLQFEANKEAKEKNLVWLSATS